MQQDQKLMVEEWCTCYEEDDAVVVAPVRPINGGSVTGVRKVETYLGKVANGFGESVE